MAVFQKTAHFVCLMLDKKVVLREVMLIKLAGWAGNGAGGLPSKAGLFIILAGGLINAAGDVAKGAGYYMNSAGHGVNGAVGGVIFFWM